MRAIRVLAQANCVMSIIIQSWVRSLSGGSSAKWTSVLSREHKQAIDWVGAGKRLSACFAGRFRIRRQSPGLPVDYINHNDLKEMPRLRGSASAITLVNKAPHPNAAKVFINWFLSRRGQIVYQESHGDRDSLRIDIPKEKVRPRSGGWPAEILFVETPEFMEREPAMKIVEDALAGKGR